METSVGSLPFAQGERAKAVFEWRSILAEMNQQVVVVSHADGVAGPENFEVVDAAMPTLPAGGALVRVLYTSADPGMRGWVSREKNYMTIPVGGVMRASGIGEIIESDHPDWKPGDHAFGWFGWQRFAGAKPEDLLWKVDLNEAPAQAWLGVLGLNGLAAWVGLKHHAQPQAGETLIVTTGAGGVGGVVGQLAKAAGLHAICLTGSDAKVALAREELGYAHAINYRTATDLRAAIAAVAPDGINIFYDNTSGALADAIFPNLALRARIIQCGTAAVASWNPPPLGPRRERDVLTKRLSWKGFVVFDHGDLFVQARAELVQAYKAGTLSARSHDLDGLEQAPGAIAMLYRGENDGKLSIRV